MNLTKVSLIFTKNHVQPGFFSYLDVLFDGHFIVTGYRVVIRKDEQYDVRVPERPIYRQCVKCRAMIPTASKFCGDCGWEQPEGYSAEKSFQPNAKRPKLHSSILFSGDKEWTNRFNECVITCCEESLMSEYPQQDFDVLNFKEYSQTPIIRRSSVSVRGAIT